MSLQNDFSTLEQKLGMQAVRELLAERCLSEGGKQYLQRMRFINRFDLVERMLKQSAEFKILLSEDSPFPSENYHDVNAILHKVRIEGFWLLEEEFHQLRQVLQTFLSVVRYFRERPGSFPELEKLMEGLLVNDLVIRRIDRILDQEGLLKSNASHELGKIAAKIQETETTLRKRIGRLFDQFSAQGYLTSQLEITVRDGRLVLPVLAEHKRHIPGFVHDESQTGQTVFIEPAACFEMNNLLREFQLAYRRERERILKETTDGIRPEVSELERNLQRLSLFDFIRAKALLSVEMKAVLPILKNHPGMNLVQAYHPLLRMSHEKTGMPTIPMSLHLNPEKHILVISGPNAGGKSICLKTAGLLQYMLQCGLLIPCESHSEMGVYKRLLADIGDEQSIENDLSTYSSHLLHMKEFCEQADAKTLFLIDEFGTGTDPQFGGPLAEAILDHLARKKAHGIVTTHFSNLKNFAANRPGLENANMLFDQEKLQPLYILETGKPGSSYAFELAVKSGLPQTLINYAKNKVGEKQKKVDELLVDLGKESSEISQLKSQLKIKEEKVQKLESHFEQLNTELEKNRKQLLRKAREEALAFVHEANIRMEATIREIREQQASSEVQRKARTQIRDEITKLKEELSAEIVHKESSSKPSQTSNSFQAGDTVRIMGQEATGSILEIKKSKALVAIGDIHTKVELNKLEKVSESNKPKAKFTPIKGIDLNQRMKDFQPELKLIGIKGEEAMRMLQEYLDDALVLGTKQIRIVHGKGYGILRKLVREKLIQNPQVEHFEDEHIEFGGDGVTIVNLKV